MMKPLMFAFSVAAFSACAPAAAFQCYSMFDSKNARVYQTSTPPIDLSGSISDQMGKYFPSRYLVIADGGSCAEVNVAPAASAGAPRFDRGNDDFAGTSPAVRSPTPYDAPAVGRQGRQTRIRR